jgi:hypothetical protein
MQWQSCYFISKFVSVFTGPIVQFWPKRAPTSVSGSRIMRPLRFGGPGSICYSKTGIFTGPVRFASLQKQLGQILSVGWRSSGCSRRLKKKATFQAPEI